MRYIARSLVILSPQPRLCKLVTLANYLMSLAKHARNFPKYLPESLLKSATSFDWKSIRGVVGGLDAMESTPEKQLEKSENGEKSYLTAAVESISPWSSSRTSTPTPISAATAPGEASGLKNQHGGDHMTQSWHGLSLKKYPADCPPVTKSFLYFQL